MLKCWNVIFVTCLATLLFMIVCHISSAYVDHWNMLNIYCFHVYAQKSLVMIVCHAVMSCFHAVMSYCHAVICQLLILIIFYCINMIYFFMVTEIWRLIDIVVILFDILCHLWDIGCYWGVIVWYWLIIGFYRAYIFIDSDQYLVICMWNGLILYYIYCYWVILWYLGWSCRPLCWYWLLSKHIYFRFFPCSLLLCICSTILFAFIRNFAFELHGIYVRNPII